MSVEWINWKNNPDTELVLCPSYKHLEYPFTVWVPYYFQLCHDIFTFCYDSPKCVCVCLEGIIVIFGGWSSKILALVKRAQNLKSFGFEFESQHHLLTSCVIWGNCWTCLRPYFSHRQNGITLLLVSQHWSTFYVPGTVLVLYMLQLSESSRPPNEVVLF